MNTCNCDQIGNDMTTGDYTITYHSGTGDYWPCPYCEPRCPYCGRPLSHYPYYHQLYRNPWVDPYYTWAAIMDNEDFELAEQGMGDYCKELLHLDKEL